MDLSYEETVQRIEKYKADEYARGTNHELCTIVKYPYDVHIYKGEGNIILVPLITSVSWTSTYMAWHKKINEMSNTTIIGNSVLEAFERIKNGHVDARTRHEREEDNFIHVSTKCTSYKSFNKKYFLCVAILKDDNTLTISKTHKLNGNKGYGGVDEGLIHLRQYRTKDSASDVPQIFRQIVQ